MKFSSHVLKVALVLIAFFSCKETTAQCPPNSLPPSCSILCNTPGCYQNILACHLVTDPSQYQEDVGPFTYSWVAINNIISPVPPCEEQLIFQIFQDNQGNWISQLGIVAPTHPDARSFPAPLIRAILDKYGLQAAYKFYWLAKSPYTEPYDDAYLKVTLNGQTLDIYNLSGPPNF